MAYNLRSGKGMKVVEEEMPSPAPEVPVVEEPDEDNVVVPESQTRALGNEYILAEVLDYLSVKDLKECRLVNKFWSQTATRVIASKSDVVYFAGCGGQLDFSRLEKFVETMASCEDLPCRKFEVRGQLVWKASPEQQLLLPKFVDKVASSVTHLSLSSPNERIFPWRKPKKRNEYSRLKSLELEMFPRFCYIKNIYSEPMKSNVDFMIHVLERSPKLASVSFTLSFDSGVANPQVFRVIEHVPWNKIYHLKLVGRLCDEHFQKFMELGAAVKLESFEIADFHLQPRPVDDVLLPGRGTFFTMFLDRQSSSLETLKLYFDRLVEPEPPPNFNRSKFPKLKTLNITVDKDINERRDLYCLFAMPSFSQQFPVLSSLTVSAIHCHELDKFLCSKDMITVETLKKLRLDPGPKTHNRNAMGEADVNIIRRVIRHLAQMFPCVTKVGVPANLNFMKAIETEESWKDMKTLTLLCGRIDENVDSALTGYTPEKCDWISGLYPGSLGFQQEEREMEGKIFKFLHNLETLELDTNRWIIYMGSCLFSDLSCRLVLLKLKNLKCLNMCGLRRGRSKPRVSKEIIQEMTRKFMILYSPEQFK